jgi:hypothetical protein
VNNCCVVPDFFLLFCPNFKQNLKLEGHWGYFIRRQVIGSKVPFGVLTNTSIACVGLVFII